jgi:hypothetical protein
VEHFFEKQDICQTNASQKSDNVEKLIKAIFPFCEVSHYFYLTKMKKTALEPLWGN